MTVNVHFRDAPFVPLREALLGENYGKRVSVEAKVVAKANTTRLIPESVRLFCQPRKHEQVCQDCPIFAPALRNTWVSISLRERPQMMLNHLVMHHRTVDRMWVDEFGIPRRCPGHTRQPHRRLNLLRVELQAVEQNRMVGPQIPCYALGDELELLRLYLFQATPVQDPLTGESVLLLHNWQASVQTRDKPADQEILAMRLDHPEQLHERAERYENGPLQIWGRRDVVLAAMLVWHSPLEFNFNGRELVRGWLELLLLGDTSEGKSVLMRNLLDFYQRGDWASGENCSKAGLLCGLSQQGRSRGSGFIMRPGLFPRNDRGLTVIDECHDMPRGVMEQLSEVRSSGIAHMAKIQDFRQHARCRKLFAANPPSRKDRALMMDSAAYPVNHVMSVMRTPEDVRRLDAVAGLARSATVREQVHLNRLGTLEEVPERERKAARALVDWIWDLPRDRVQWTGSATEYALAAGRQMLDRYSSNIPLVDHGEAAIKIARWSAAVAGACFSTDLRQHALEVREEHVEFAVNLLHRLYDGTDLQYLHYSRSQQRLSKFSAQDVRLVGQLLMARKAESFGSGSKTALDWILSQSEDRPMKVEEFAGLGLFGSLQSKWLFKDLKRAGMLRGRGDGFHVTHKGRIVLRECVRWLDSGKDLTMYTKEF